MSYTVVDLLPHVVPAAGENSEHHLGYTPLLSRAIFLGMKPFRPNNAIRAIILFVCFSLPSRKSLETKGIYTIATLSLQTLGLSSWRILRQQLASFSRSFFFYLVELRYVMTTSWLPVVATCSHKSATSPFLRSGGGFAGCAPLPSPRCRLRIRFSLHP